MGLITFEKPPEEKPRQAAADETSKLSPTAERAADRRREILEQNHNIAAFAYDLEQYTMASGDAVDPSIVKQQLEQLPDAVRGRFATAYERYATQRAEAQRLEDTFLTVAAQEGQRDITPQTWGRYAFGLLIKSQPEGQVTFQREGGYFLMTFASKHDYVAAVDRRNAQAGSVISEMGGGAYRRAPPIYFYGTGEKPVPVIMARRQQMNDTVRESLMTHERQHFINGAVMDTFGLAEQKKLSPEERRGKLDASSVMRFRRIKDEVIAMVRDGSSGDDLKNNLESKLYADLFHTLAPDAQSHAQEIISDVSYFLNANRQSLQSDRARALIVYQLMAVPFLEFPKWLKALGDFYQERIGMLEQFDDICSFNFHDRGGSRMYVSDLPHDLYPSSLQHEAAAVAEDAKKPWKDLYDYYYQMRKRLLDGSVTMQPLGNELPQRLQEYRERYEEFARHFTPLKRDGVLVPHADRRNVTEIQNNKVNVVKETPEIAALRQHIVDAVSEFPQEHIDTLALSPGERAMGNFDQSHELLIRTLQNIFLSQRIAMWSLKFAAKPGFPHSACIEIHFTTPKAQNSEKFYRGAVSVYLHSSEFKL